MTFISILYVPSGKYVVEYRPLDGGAIEVIAVEFTPRAGTWQQQRAQYQRTPEC